MKEENIITCNLCNKRETCTQLCTHMEAFLKNGKYKNGVYAESTNNLLNKHFVDENILDAVSFAHGLSNIEERDAKKIMIALLTPQQKSILKLYNDGLSQEEIAKELSITQSGVSQKLKTIKKHLKDSFVDIIDGII